MSKCVVENCKNITQWGSDRCHKHNMNIDNGIYGEDAPDLSDNTADILDRFLKDGPQTSNRASPVDSTEDELDKVLNLLESIIANAAPDGTQDDGDFVGFYVLKTGLIHKAIPLLRKYKRVDMPMGDPLENERYQAHLENYITTKCNELLDRLESKAIKIANEDTEPVVLLSAIEKERRKL